MLLRVLIGALLVLLPSTARAEKRVALVVGNAAYQHGATLADPVNDARDIAATLTSVGFEVILGTDLEKRAFDRKVRDLARALENG